jgi:hypothetical protein
VPKGRSRLRRYYVWGGWILSVIVLSGTVVSSTSAAPVSPALPTASSTAAPGDTNCHEDPMAHVHDPSRFDVVNACETISGTVTRLDFVQAYGDHVIWVQPDRDQRELLTSANQGLFVADVIPTDRASIDLPQVGQHASLSGAWVQDVVSGAMQMHPTWAITTNKTKTPPEPTSHLAVTTNLPSSVPVGERIDPVVHVLSPSRKGGRKPGAQVHLFVELDTLNGRGVAWWAAQTNTLGFTEIDAVALQVPGEYVLSVFAWKNHHTDETHNLLTIRRR